MFSWSRRKTNGLYPCRRRRRQCDMSVENSGCNMQHSNHWNCRLLALFSWHRFIFLPPFANLTRLETGIHTVSTFVPWIHTLWISLVVINTFHEHVNHIKYHFFILFLRNFKFVAHSMKNSHHHLDFTHNFQARVRSVSIPNATCLTQVIRYQT
jgi:hypothetical protein